MGTSSTKQLYNTFSFTLASMNATTIYLWFRADGVADKYNSAVYISAFVTFTAAYHYMRIFNSWLDAYDCSRDAYITHLDGPLLTGVLFNDAYHHMDWLLTVPLPLLEILLVMNLDDKDLNSKEKKRKGKLYGSSNV